MKKRIVLALMLLSGGISTVQAYPICFPLNENSSESLKSQCDAKAKKENAGAYGGIVNILDAQNMLVTFDENGNPVRGNGDKAVHPLQNVCCMEIPLHQRRERLR